MSDADILVFGNLRFQQDVLRLQITVDQPCVLEDGESVKKLCSEYFDQLGAEPTERVLLDEFVKIR